MAVAVSLGTKHISDDDKDDARLLAKLIWFPSERVRYRAAKSASLRGRRFDISQGATDILAEEIQLALNQEKARDVITALEEAKMILALPQ
ncbi:hypothetical protein KFU94_17600 [Chloroflexi bacterium TSY]|nr:hypothetical protein [Chloroflexi bacterium TSY]